MMMEKRIGLIVFLLVIGKPTLGGQTSSEEKERLLGIQAPVVLTESQTVRPVLSVLYQGALYYANSGDDRVCVGKDLYSVSLQTGKEEKLASLPCVTRLQVFTENLLVTYRNRQNEWRFDKWEGNKLQPILEKAIPLAKARLYFKRDEIEGHKERDIYPLFHLGKEQLTAMVCSGESLEDKPLALMDIYSLKDEKPLYQSVINYSATLSKFALQDFEIDTNGLLYLTGYNIQEDGSPAWGRIFVYDTSKGEKKGEFGVNRQPPRNWKSIPPEQWSSKRPAYLELTPHGILVAGFTGQLAEFWTVTYFNRPENSFHKLNIKSNDIGGLSFVNDGKNFGLVISKPEAKQILFYGDIELSVLDQNKPPEVIPDPMGEEPESQKGESK